MRSRWRTLGVAVALPFLASGCVFNLGCEIFGSLNQAKFPQLDVCGAFSGECCGDQDGDGLPDECSGFLGQPPCGRFDTSGCFCFGGGDFVGVGQTLLPEPAAYALPPNASFDLRLPLTGFSSSHHLFFDVVANDLETFRSVLTYPSTFGFNGFLALGPAETQIGAYGVDFNQDGIVDLSLPLRALGAETAYVDGNGNGRLDASDPTLAHSGAHVFTTTLPRGGDGLARVKLGRVAMRATAALYAGILTNPVTPGDHQVTSSFTSVDPDSGDADDGLNQAPVTFAPAPADVTVFPSGVEGLPPFLCYKTKPTKGTLCSEAAAANAGGACASDAECGGTAGACVKTPLPKGLTESVEDQVGGLGPRTFTIAKGASLCAPAELNGGGQPLDPARHFRGHPEKLAKGEPTTDAIRLLPVVTELGTAIVDIKKPVRLLTPSAKSLNGPVDPLPGTDGDHFNCYGVKTNKKRCASNPERKCKRSADCGVDGPCLTGFPKNLTVQVGDQFTGFATPKTLAVKKPSRLCFAADARGGYLQPGALLLCYQAKSAAGAPKHEKIVGRIHLATALARERIDTVKEEELCLPAVQAGAR